MNKPNRVIHIAVLVAGLLACSQALGGPLYKCVDAKGVAAYQQTPCPQTSKEAGRRSVPTAAPSTQLSWAKQAGSVAKQERARQQLYDSKPRTAAAPQAQSYTAAQEPATPPPPPVRRSDLGQTQIDQYGNPYTKAAPNILIDQKTGKPCVTNGNNEIIFCH